MGIFYTGNLTGRRDDYSINDVTEPYSSAMRVMYDYISDENIVTSEIRRRERDLLDFYKQGEVKPDGDAAVFRSGRVSFRERKPVVDEQDVLEIAELSGLSDTGRLPFEEGHSRDYWKSMVEVVVTKEKRENTMGRAEHDAAFYASTLGVGLFAMAKDPVNILTSFIPVVGPSRYARMIGQAGGALGRIAVRAKIGAAEGFVGATLIEPFTYAILSQEDADYGAETALLNVASGAVFGGTLRALTGPLADKHILAEFDAKKVAEFDRQMMKADTIRSSLVENVVADGTFKINIKSAEQPALKSLVVKQMRAADAQTREAVIRAAVNQVMQGKRIDVLDILNADPSVKALTRGFSNDDISTIVNKVVSDVADEVENTLATANTRAISRADRKDIGQGMERMKRKISDLIKQREALQKDIGAVKGNDAQWAIVKQDKGIKAKINEIKDDVSEMRKVLDDNKELTRARVELNRMMADIESGKLQSDVLGEAQLIRSELLSEAQPAVTKIDAGNKSKNPKAAEESLEMDAQVAKASDEESMLDAEMSVIDEEIKMNLNEAETVNMNKALDDVTESTSVVMKHIEDLITCRVS